MLAEANSPSRIIRAKTLERLRRRLAQDEADRRLGNYILTDEIGRGASGTVWKAWDRPLRRWVAVKIFKGNGDSKLFLAEARAAAKLIHPNIVRIHHVGMQEDRPYLVMDYIDGGSLDGPALSSREAAGLVREAALAIEYIHQRGMLHRDLKPLNLLRDRAGRVYVADFGLAAVSPRRRAGTPAYMAPEQARAEGADARTDVYALGATLYRLISGQAPSARPSPLRAPAPLRRIVRKCLEKDPARRYESAAALAADLDRWLAPPRRSTPVGLAILVGILTLLVARPSPEAKKHEEVAGRPSEKSLAGDDRLLGDAQEELHRKRPDEARSRFLSLWNRGAHLGEAAAGLAEAYALSRQFEEAIQWSTTALVLRPEAGWLYVHRAEARWAQWQGNPPSPGERELIRSDLETARRLGAPAERIDSILGQMGG